MMFGFGVVANAQNAKKNILIVYFSQSGNTKTVAELVKKHTGGDIFRIETERVYPEDRSELTEAVLEELRAGVRPELKGEVENFDKYDVIYLGSPNWWNTIAPAVAVFLESHNFEGKIIVPFVTHAGSRMGISETDIKKLAPKAKVLKGLPVHGSNVARSEGEIKEWVRRSGHLK